MCLPAIVGDIEVEFDEGGLAESSSCPIARLKSHAR
jgi:hypothetical protein